MTLHINLPWTKPPLTANQRLHWAERARITREVRQTARLLSRCASPCVDGVLVVTLHYRPAQRRVRDRQNLAPTAKACIDGLIDSGLAEDDDSDHLSAPEPVIHPPEKALPGALWLELDYPKEVK